MTTTTTPPSAGQAALPWNDWMRRARAGDTAAVHCFCDHARPIVDGFTRSLLFLHRLGRDEIRSAGSLAALNFMMEYEGATPDREIPYLLQRVIHCCLLDEVRRIRTRERYELPEKESAGETEDDGRPPALSRPEAVRTPEEILLEKERNRRLQEAVSHLRGTEKTVIQSLFYQHKNTRNVAQELGCSVNYVQKVQRRALTRLRRILAARPMA